MYTDERPIIASAGMILPMLIKKNAYILLVALVLLASASLGAVRLNQQGFWFDEIISLDSINDYTATAQRFPEQMPAYFVALRGWMALTGESELAGRWGSLLLGLIALSVAYRLAASLFSRDIGLYALCILGSSAFFLRYFREMRPYTLLALAAVVSIFFFTRWTRTQRIVCAIVWLLASLILVYIHYFAGLVIAVQGLYFLATAQIDVISRRVTFTQTHGITFGVFVLIAFSLSPYVASYTTGLGRVTSGQYSSYALSPAQAVSSMTAMLTNDSAALAVLLCLLAVATRRRFVGFAALWAFFPVVLVLLVNAFVFKVFAGPRYLLFIWPAFAILLALGAAQLGRWRNVALGILVLTGVAQVIADLPRTVPGTLNNPPWREMAAFIDTHAAPNTLILVNMVDAVGLTGYREPMGYYFNRSVHTANPTLLDLLPYPGSDALRAKAQTASEAWIVATDGTTNARGEVARSSLRDGGFAECRVWPYATERTFLSYWARIADTRNVTFENGATISAVPLNSVTTPIIPDSTIDIALGLYTTQTLPLDYSLGVYLLDADGRVAAQQDGPPAGLRTSQWKPGERFCDYRTLHLPDATGDYTLRAALYDPISGVRLALDQGGDALITLQSITIAAR